MGSDGQVSVNRAAPGTRSPAGAAAGRDRLVIFAGIAILMALAWAYTIRLAWNSASMPEALATANTAPWNAADFGFMFVMWAVMMVAMMLPSVTPTVLLFARMRQAREPNGRPYVSPAAFGSGYFLVWSGFSLAATIVNWMLHENGALSSMMGHVVSGTGGVLLIAAGAFQWTPLKHACLEHCRSPLGSLVTNWRNGALGATTMGIRHGIYCLGCCWMLMALLFVLGVMNLSWIAILAGVVLAEKVLPRGETLSRLLGVLLAFWGLWLLASR